MEAPVVSSFTSYLVPHGDERLLASLDSPAYEQVSGFDRLFQYLQKRFPVRWQTVGIGHDP